MKEPGEELVNKPGDCTLCLQCMGPEPGSRVYEPGDGLVSMPVKVVLARYGMTEPGDWLCLKPVVAMGWCKRTSTVLGVQPVLVVHVVLVVWGCTRWSRTPAPQ